MTYYLGYGTVQAFVSGPHYMHFFGPVEYEREKPIIKDWMRSHAQPIVDALNDETITEAEASAALDTIHYFTKPNETVLRLRLKYPPDR